MKVKDLIKYLRGSSPEAEVILYKDGNYMKFTGINTDDSNDVELYVCTDDRVH